MDFAAARRNFVAGQVRANDVTDHRLQDALLAVPRERFVPKNLRPIAYAETDIEVAPGRFLLEARDYGKLAQAARLHRGDVVLDVGCATGYSAAVLARLAETVIALESDAALAARATETLMEIGADNAVVVEGALNEGAKKHGPYDVIMVNGAAPDAPSALLDQLAEGGRLLGFVGEGPVTRATRFEKHGGHISRIGLFDAAAPALPGFERAVAFSF